MTQNINTKNRGFTIVELLIVIVIIAILAAITIVAYNGIQTRAKASAVQATVNTVIKKAESANAVANAYPQNAAGFTAQKDSDMTGSGVTFVTTAPTSTTNSPTSVVYTPCTGTAGTGAVITYWDYNANNTATKSIGQPTAAGTCTAGTAFAQVW